MTGTSIAAWVMLIAAICTARAWALPARLNDLSQALERNATEFSYEADFTVTEYVEVVVTTTDGKPVPSLQPLDTPRRSRTHLSYERRSGRLVLTVTPLEVHPSHSLEPYARQTVYHVTRDSVVLADGGNGAVEQTSIRRATPSLPHRLPSEILVYDPQFVMEQVWPLLDAESMQLRLSIHEAGVAPPLPDSIKTPDGTMIQVQGRHGTAVRPHLVRTVWLDRTSSLPTLIVGQLRDRLMSVTDIDWGPASEGQPPIPQTVRIRYFSRGMGSESRTLAREHVLAISRSSIAIPTGPAPRPPDVRVTLPAAPSTGPVAPSNDEISPFTQQSSAVVEAEAARAAARDHPWWWGALLALAGLAVLAHWAYRRRFSR